ncbi:hypothetical protein INT48_000941 [Thamnidium elegans]|uniref:Mid2 domain-containing protein n=1 Tax=Thamnidium elegans TaxID=101142 RepID=A0A8H7SQL6_9FUNG|nr:hypothetical protein INT48_000941 [Thamnidium elegans]
MSIQEFTKRQDDSGYDYTDSENNDNVNDTITDDTDTGDSNGDYDETTTTTTYTDESYTTTSYYPTETDSLTDSSTYYEPTTTTDLLASTWVPTQTPIDPIISSTPTITSSTSTFTSPSPTIDSGVTENANGGGLSDKNKAIIGGVVGGIGGAALLGFAAFLLISRWKRNRRASDRESFHPQADDNVSVHSPQMSGYHDSADYSYYNTATNHSADRIIPNDTPRY